MVSVHHITANLLPIIWPSVIPCSTLSHCRKREPFTRCNPWQAAPTYLCGGRCRGYSTCKCRGSQSKEWNNGEGFHCSGKVLLEFKRNWSWSFLYNGECLLYLDFVFYGVCFVYRSFSKAYMLMASKSEIGLNCQLNNRVNGLTWPLTLIVIQWSNLSSVQQDFISQY
jgi:hypothetical protein